MKITRVIPRIVRRDMGGRVWNPRTRWQEKVMVLAPASVLPSLPTTSERRP